MPVASKQSLQSSEIVRQSTDDLLFLKPVSHGHLNRTIKWQLAAVDFLESLVGFDQDEVVFQQLGAESSTRLFNAFGQLDLLSPCQQRDLTHLGQVHANRIVGP